MTESAAWIHVLGFCALLAPVLSLLPPPGHTPSSSRSPPLVTVFSTECTSYHDWQAVALYYTWSVSKIPGRLVRIMECNQSARNEYKHLHLGDDMETHIPSPAEGLGLLPKGNMSYYTALNKPLGLLSWLIHGSGRNLPDNTPILVVDPDMFFLADQTNNVLTRLADRIRNEDVKAFGTGYPYVVNGLKAQEFSIPRHFGFSNESAQSLQSLGAPLMMQRKDLAKVTPGWYDYTLKIVQNPNIWKDVHDGKKPAPWIAEMIGYVLSAASWLPHEIEVTAPQPPWDSPDSKSVVLHYTHTFNLCGRHYGKERFRDTNPLRCDLDLEVLRPPSDEEVAKDSCEFCHLSEIDAATGKCHTSHGTAASKTNAHVATKMIYYALSAWRSHTCKPHAPMMLSNSKGMAHSHAADDSVELSSLVQLEAHLSDEL